MTMTTPTPVWSLGDLIRKARMQADLDQAQLAAAVGSSRPTISNWERGIAEPSATAFVRLARATGVPLDWFAAAVSDVARPEGFEPPTFWSGASALLALTLAAMRDAVAR